MVIEIDLVDLSREDTQCGICFADLDATVGQIDDAGVLYVSMIIHSIVTNFPSSSPFVAVLGLASILFLLRNGLVLTERGGQQQRADVVPCLP